MTAQILIVDDDRLVLHGLSAGLRNAGYRTVEADSGASALKIARELPIDLAIVDVNMPGMSGVELAGHFRNHPAVPCIFLSAYADASIVKRAVADGALGYLVKPLDVPSILPTIEAALASARELAALKRARSQLNVELEAARSEGAANLAGVVDSSWDAIISVDEDWRIVVFNCAAEAMFRCKAEEVIGRHFERFVPQRFRAAHQASAQAFVALGEGSRSMGKRGEVFGLRADGEEFPVEATIAKSVVSGRNTVNVVLRDISERRRAEETQRQLENQLRESQKMEAVGTLAGGIAHDFNNILAAILGNVALARQEVGAGHCALVSLEEVAKAGERAKQLVQQILMFSRRQPVEMVDQPLHPLVEEAGRLLRAALPAGIELLIACVPRPLQIRANATQIEQVLLNLCINAWHAMHGETGRIEIRLDEFTADAGVRPDLQPGRYARIGVIDNGSGMDEATQARIFEPFFTTKELGHGTGLGLAVAQGVVKAHRGVIGVRSVLGEGTIFEICFPCVAAPEAVAEPVAAAPHPDGGMGRQVLYLDDDESMVIMTRRMLERSGYRVKSFAQPKAALAELRARSADFDLVLTDFNLPEMSGLEVAQEVARIRSDLPVAIVSGYVTDELMTRARQLGVREVFSKQDVIVDLGGAIASLLAAACAATGT